jgi:hypothetical protein
MQTRNRQALAVMDNHRAAAFQVARRTGVAGRALIGTARA